ncbi:MAG: sugar phosphate nucleotidyltransferase [Eubacteriales bacterium]|jgi:NDP-sugar pyrophosphorylase family protein|nr:sugar phosphate nucleotidyltransferase [Eubacteriales bacterium]MDD3573132.1 sugar phosphate nucleotidyltransferase [Eubacteriales bacterium]NLO12844.1 NTP transferase domain-containing protein [Clostridiales bacterium]
MKEPILVVMAAGIGSRFGGLKQMTPFGLHGESLIDYSLFDALRSGFKRVVFIVNGKIIDDFKDLVGSHVEGRMEVTYVNQELDMLPHGLTVPPGRVKPWGTSHAVLCSKDVIDAPFCAINGDDLYGLDAMQKMYAFLKAGPQPHEYAMVGFDLKNTLSEHGYVSRGICQVDENDYLENVIERLHIISTVDGPLHTLDQKTYHRLPEDTTVSMNMWAFTPQVLDEIEAHFPTFYKKAMAENPLKAEFYLPNLVGDLLRENKATVKVMRSRDKWFGVTNASDRPIVEEALKELTRHGVYPDGLWR